MEIRPSDMRGGAEKDEFIEAFAAAFGIRCQTTR